MASGADVLVVMTGAFRARDHFRGDLVLFLPRYLTCFSTLLTDPQLYSISDSLAFSDAGQVNFYSV